MAESTALVNCSSLVFKNPSAGVAVSRWPASEFSSRAACAMLNFFMVSPLGIGLRDFDGNPTGLTTPMFNEKETSNE